MNTDRSIGVVLGVRHADYVDLAVVVVGHDCSTDHRQRFQLRPTSHTGVRVSCSE
jgi:hypothetical protein